jgi:hypothetical protein
MYENGEITPIEPVPDVKSAEVLVIFPEQPGAKPEPAPPGTDWEAELFGSGKGWWTDEVDAAVRESWKVRTRPPELEPGDGFDAPE